MLETKCPAQPSFYRQSVPIHKLRNHLQLRGISAPTLSIVFLPVCSESSTHIHKHVPKRINFIVNQLTYSPCIWKYSRKMIQEIVQSKGMSRYKVTDHAYLIPILAFAFFEKKYHNKSYAVRQNLTSPSPRLASCRRKSGTERKWHSFVSRQGRHEQIAYDLSGMPSHDCQSTCLRTSDCRSRPRMGAVVLTAIGHLPLIMVMYMKLY